MAGEKRTGGIKKMKAEERRQGGGVQKKGSGR